MTEEDRKAKAELELIMMDESGQNQKKGLINSFPAKIFYIFYIIFL